MPIVHTSPQILCNIIHILLRLELTGAARANSWEAHDTIRLILGYGTPARRLAQVLRIRGPVAFGDFDSNQAGQRLLLTGTVEGRKFTADRDGRRGNGILRRCRTWTQVRLHCLNVIVMATAIGRRLGFRIIGGRLDNTVIAGVLGGRLGAGGRGQALNAFAVRGRITAFPATIGIATFTRVVV